MGCSAALNQAWTLPVGKQAHAPQEGEAISDISTAALKTVGRDAKLGEDGEPAPRQQPAAGRRAGLGDNSACLVISPNA